MKSASDPSLIARPVAAPKRAEVAPLPGAWDTHAHMFGPADKFPFAPGRGAPMTVLLRYCAFEQAAVLPATEGT